MGQDRAGQDMGKNWTKDETGQETGQRTGHDKGQDEGQDTQGHVGQGKNNKDRAMIDSVCEYAICVTFEIA